MKGFRDFLIDQLAIARGETARAHIQALLDANPAPEPAQLDMFPAVELQPPPAPDRPTAHTDWSAERKGLAFKYGRTADEIEAAPVRPVGRGAVVGLIVGALVLAGLVASGYREAWRCEAAGGRMVQRGGYSLGAASYVPASSVCSDKIASR